MGELFRITKIPTTHVYQNHLDKLHDTLSRFTNIHKKYSWGVVKGRKILEDQEAITYLLKEEPQRIRYIVYSNKDESYLFIDIHDGVIINMKNGDTTLYGLFNLLIDDFDQVKVPQVLLTLRKHWLLVVILSVWITGGAIFGVFTNLGWLIFWLIAFPIASLILAVMAISDSEFDFDWDEIVLKTKIKYKNYRIQLGSPLYGFLTSTKTIISILAAVATILSTLFIFLAD
jgi:hypothetical protein